MATPILTSAFVGVTYTQSARMNGDQPARPQTSHRRHYDRLPVQVTGLLSDRALALNPVSHKAYTVDSAQGALIVIDARAQSRTIVKVGAGPVAVAVNTKTNRVYVANNGSGSVSVLDGKTDAVIATVDAGKTPYVLAVDEGTNTVYVSNTFSNVIRRIDGTTNEVRLLKAGSADRMIVDEKHDAVILLGYEADSLTMLDGDNGSVRHAPAGAMHLWGLALDEGTSEAWVTRIGSDDVVALDVARSGASAPDKGRSMPTAIATGSMPCAVAIDAQRKRVYVANYAGNSVSIIDEGSQALLGTIVVGAQPRAIVVDQEADLVYVANTRANSISIINAERQQVIATRYAGVNPYALALDEPSGTLYVANLGKESVAQLDVRELRLAALKGHP